MPNDLVISEQTATSGAPDGVVHGGTAHNSGSFRSSSSRRAEIERIRDTDFSRYENDASLRAEYLSLLKHEMGQISAVELANTANVRDALSETKQGAKLTHEWTYHNMFKERVEQAQTVARDILSTIGGEQKQADFMARLDEQVSVEIQAVIIDEISSRKPDFVSPVDLDGVAKFATDPIGRRYVDAWKGDAPFMIATLHRRVERITAQLNQTQQKELFDWFDSLSDAEASAVISRLLR